MPKLVLVSATEDSRPHSTQPLLPMLPEPDQGFERLSADLAGRKVIIHFRTKPEDNPNIKRLAWIRVSPVTRMEIGMAAQALNRARINWRELGGIKGVVAADARLRNVTEMAPQVDESVIEINN